MDPLKPPFVIPPSLRPAAAVDGPIGECTIDPDDAAPAGILDSVRRSARSSPDALPIPDARGQTQAADPIPAPQPPAPLDPQALYQSFLKGEAGATLDHLAYQNRGIDNSPYARDVPQYAARLQAAPAALGEGFPALGAVPLIEDGLGFLPPVIGQACVCISTVDANGNGRLQWLGRNATQCTQQWSSTKLVPIVRTAVLAGDVDLSSCTLRDANGQKPPQSIPQVFGDIVSYRSGTWTSNAYARMLKQFDTPEGQEGWLEGISGNRDLEFRGGYGAPPYIERPVLVDALGNRVLASPGADHRGNNSVSCYDLCRLVAMVGLQPHLAQNACLPSSPRALHAVVDALGTDCARYTDVAVDALGTPLTNPVILSKMGSGVSDTRHTSEAVYTAYVQFGRPDGGTTAVAMSLRASQPLTAGDPQAFENDAWMATAVTQVLERALQ